MEDQGRIPISQVRPPLQGDFGSMTENQGSLQVPSTNAIPTGLGQGQQTEFFGGNATYITLLLLVIWVFLVSISVPNKVFRILNMYSLVDMESERLTVLGSCLVAFITVVIYFASNFFTKQ